jgi:hypothetical protein
MRKVKLAAASIFGTLPVSQRGMMDKGGQMATQESRVRNRLWLWGHDAGAHNESWGLPNASRITPVEAAFYLGIPNVIMVRYLGRPSLPFDQFAVPFRPLKQVVWSVVGAKGETDQKEQKHVLELAARYPNLAGVIMDDFFAGAFENGTKDDVAALSLKELRQLRGRLTVGGRRLDLWAVLYEHQLDKSLDDYLSLLDKVSFWTWDSDKLRDLKSNFEKFEIVAPKCGKVLGLYMWDYGKKRPMPLDLMQRQCELGLEWLKATRLDGMIFLASCICDLELETVEWTRRWITEVGDMYF